MSTQSRRAPKPMHDGASIPEADAHVKADAAQLLPAETVYADELRFLAAWDPGSRPPGWPGVGASGGDNRRYRAVAAL